MCLQELLLILELSMHDSIGHLTQTRSSGG